MELGRVILLNIAGKTFYGLNNLDYISIKYRNIKDENKELAKEKSQDDGEDKEIWRPQINNLKDVLIDLEKELGSWNPELIIPELGTYSKNVIRVGPNLNTNISPRLKLILEHPIFSRLKMVSQLGLVSLIYPTADHSRFDHSLGTYTYTSWYVKSLFYDSQNPIFHNLAKKEDIKAILLASLLHDLGQYPLAHDLEEVCPVIFKHSTITINLLNQKVTNSNGQTLEDIITNKQYGWGIEIEYINKILSARSLSLTTEELDLSLEFKIDLLSAIIDGPIDADKADYVTRDSIQSGVPYGKQMDIERLLRVLTIAVVTRQDSPKHRVSIGIYGKGLASVRAFGLARNLLFSSIYWQHTSRILKAMVQYDTALLLPPEVFETSELNPVSEKIFENLLNFIIKLYPPFKYKRPKIKKKKTEEKMEMEKEPPKKVIATITKEKTESKEKKDSDNWYPGISWTDWLMLKWLQNLYGGDERGGKLIENIKNRQLYKRLLSIPRNNFTSNEINKLQELPWRKRIELCESIQNEIKTMIINSWPNIPTILPIELNEVKKLMGENLAIIIDIPKLDEKLIGFSRPLAIVPELKEKSYYLDDEKPRINKDLSAVLIKMMEDSAPIRLLCHPDLHQTISAALREMKQRRSSTMSSLLTSTVKVALKKI